MWSHYHIMSDDDDDSSQIVRRGRLEIHQTCVCLFLLYHGPPVCTRKDKEKRKKERQSVVLCQDHCAFWFHQIEYSNRNTELQGEDELSLLMFYNTIQFQRFSLLPECLYRTNFYNFIMYITMH